MTDRQTDMLVEGVDRHGPTDMQAWVDGRMGGGGGPGQSVFREGENAGEECIKACGTPAQR